MIPEVLYKFKVKRSKIKVKGLIAFKFGTEFHHVTGDTVQMFKGQRSRSQRKVKYQLQKRYNTAMVRFRDFKLGSATRLKQEGAGVARATSSCNAFTIATFSNFHLSGTVLFGLRTNSNFVIYEKRAKAQLANKTLQSSAPATSYLQLA